MPQLINQEDLLSATIYIKLKNLTTQTVVDSKFKTVKGVNIGGQSDSNLVQLLEILPPLGMVLSVPKYTCTTGHELELELSLTNMSKEPFNAKLLCRVMEFEKIAQDQDRIRIELKTVTDVEWKKFCDLYSKRQEAIKDFLKSAKG